MQEYIRMFQTENFEQVRIELRYSDQPHKNYFEQWFDMPAHLGCECNPVVFPRAWRQLRHIDFDESAWLVALERVDAVYGSHDYKDLVLQIRHYLKDYLDSESVSQLPTPEEMAGRMNVSSEPLIHRLGEVSLSYRDMLDKVLKKRALEMPGAPDHSVQYIATRLGYSDAKSFRRAFKW